MIPDECVIRVDCRPQPGVTTEQVRAEIERCLSEARLADQRFAAEVVLADVKNGYLAKPDDPVVRWLPRRSGWYGAGSGACHRELARRHGELRRQGAHGHLRPGGPPVYCPDEHLRSRTSTRRPRCTRSFAALALTGHPDANEAGYAAGGR
jgi:hypothetical protein